jgi:hypothetical protein
MALRPDLPRMALLHLLLAAGLLASAGSCGTRPSAPTACADDSACPLDAHCRTGTCVADAPPRASASGPSTAMVHAEVTFDGSASTDDDDGLAGYTWSVRMRSAACAPDPGVGTGRTFRPLFPCPGTFDVILVVKDATGLASEPAIVPVSVADRPGAPPTVTAGPELTLRHRCGGTPPACSVVGPDGRPSFQLSAAGRDRQGSDAVRYRWEWAAPPPAGAAPPLVLFTEGADRASPTVSITGAGAPLAGPWTFVVTVTDANGLSARAEQPVLVQDEPPAVTGGGDVTAAVAYDAAAGRYRATGTLPFSAADPDGDPVALSWRFASSAADHCTFGMGAGGDGTCELACADVAELTSGALRTVTLQATDPSGAASRPATWTLAALPPPP